MSGVQVDNKISFGQKAVPSDVRKSCVFFCRRGKASVQKWYKRVMGNKVSIKYDIAMCQKFRLRNASDYILEGGRAS